MRDPYSILPLALGSLLALPLLVLPPVFLPPIGGKALAAASETAPPGVTSESRLTEGDRARLESGLAAAKRKQWQEVRRLAAKMSDPLAAKILLWRYYSNGDGSIDFMALARFIVENPGWPRQKALLRQAEKAMGDDVGDADRIAWFTRYPPTSTDAQQSLAEILLRRGQVNEAVQWLRYIWIEDDLAQQESRRFYDRYKRYLAEGDPYHCQCRKTSRLLGEKLGFAPDEMVVTFPPASLVAAAL